MNQEDRESRHNREKGDEYVIVEVKPSNQLRRYSQTKAKLVMVTSVVEGRSIEIWGEKELSS